MQGKSGKKGAKAHARNGEIGTGKWPIDQHNNRTICATTGKDGGEQTPEWSENRAGAILVISAH